MLWKPGKAGKSNFFHAEVRNQVFICISDLAHCSLLSSFVLHVYTLTGQLASCSSQNQQKWLSSEWVGFYWSSSQNRYFGLSTFGSEYWGTAYSAHRHWKCNKTEQYAGATRARKPGTAVDRSNPNAVPKLRNLICLHILVLIHHSGNTKENQLTKLPEFL